MLFQVNSEAIKDVVVTQGILIALHRIGMWHSYFGHEALRHPLPRLNGSLWRFFTVCLTVECFYRFALILIIAAV